MKHWTQRLTKAQREHLRQNCVPNEGLRNKTLVVERASESASRGCVECAAVLTRLQGAK